MSNFTRKTYNPQTGAYEDADWIDNYFGPHEYGVRFADGKVYSVSYVVDSNDRINGILHEPVLEEDKK